ncbi:GTPase activating protein [Entophlyctis sp. JEL0112]|nr:GTPase activating protein [Entophlyctis sp. JEL0112]
MPRDDHASGSSSSSRPTPAASAPANTSATDTNNNNNYTTTNVPLKNNSTSLAVSLLFASPDVSKLAVVSPTSSNTPVPVSVPRSTLGFLCLVLLRDHHPAAENTSDEYAWAWVPKPDITPEALKVFRRVAKASAVALKGTHHSAPASPSPAASPVSPSIPSSSSHVPPSPTRLTPLSSIPAVPSRPASPFDFFFSLTSSATPSIHQADDKPKPNPARSPTSAKRPLSINTIPATESNLVVLPSSAYVVLLSTIKNVLVEMNFGVTTSGEEAALVSVLFRTKVTVFEKDEDFLKTDEFNTLWFEKASDGTPNVTIESVVAELHVWLTKACQKGLKPVFDDENVTDGMVFHILDSKDLLLPSNYSTGTNKDGIPNERANWPNVVPAAVENNAIYKLGAYGLGMAAKIVGPDVANRVEAIGKSAAWDMLSGLSQVTKLATDTGRHVVEHPLARPVLPLIPSQITAMLMSSEEANQLMSEYDSAHLYLANFAGGIQERVKNRMLQKRGRFGSVADSEYEFENLTADLKSKRTGVRMTVEMLVAMYDEYAKLQLSEADMKHMIFFGGVSPQCRKEIWRYLLKVQSWNSTEAERIQRMKTLRMQYLSLKRQWQTLLFDFAHIAEQSRSPAADDALSSAVGDERVEGDLVSKLKERKHRIGMNDLLSPILAVMDDEVEAFWGFVGWMDLKRANFFRDQSGMNAELELLESLLRFIDPPLHLHLEKIDATNLFCCFRWILVVFKREFKFDEVIDLWEAIWACPFTKYFHLFIALAILNKHRHSIMTQCTAFDETLKFANDLAETHNVAELLQRAELLFYVFRVRFDAAVQALDDPKPAHAQHAGGTGGAMRSRASTESVGGFLGDELPRGERAGALSRSSSRSTLGGALGAAGAGVDADDVFKLVVLFDF